MNPIYHTDKPPIVKTMTKTKKHGIPGAKSYIHPTAVIDAGAGIGNGVSVWHFCHLRNGAVLEDDVSLGKGVYIDVGVRIGKGSRIQNNVSIYSGVNIASWCFIGPHVIFTNDLMPRAGKKSWHIIETTLETGTSIGAGAVICCGVTIGAFAMVGAGTIVTKSVPPFYLAVGVPARVTKKVCACGQSLLPIKTPSSQSIRACCKRNLIPETLKAAENSIAEINIIKNRK